MKIILPCPAQETSEAAIQVLDATLKNFRRLKREEQHIIEIAGPVAADPFLSAAIGALILQYQREGYLLQIKGCNVVDLCLPIEIGSNRLELGKIQRKDIRNALYYLLGELIDNISDHARAQVALLRGETTDERFSFGVVDTGISIPGAYRSAGIAIRDDCDALQKALAGLSTKTVEERGTGLPSTRKLMSEAFPGGVLRILSGNALLEAEHELTCRSLPFYWQGTIVLVQGNFPKSEINFYEIIAR